MSASAESGWTAGAHRPARIVRPARRWLALLAVTLLTGALAWVSPTAQADVSPAAIFATTTTLSAPATGSYGDAPLLTATVTPSGATGTVDFFEGDQATTPCQDVPVSADGTARCQMRTLGVGTYQFRADFHGVGEYTDSSGSATTVIDRAATSFAYTGPTSGTVGEPLRLSAVLSETGGEVLHGRLATFLLGETSPCAAIESPDGTHWCFWTPTEPGTTTITMDFSPGPFGNYEPTSLDVQITVGDAPQQTPTTTVLTAPATAEFGIPLTLNAQVSPNLGGGTIDFSGDGAPLCTARPVAAGGSATCTVEGLAVGQHTFTAAFSGSATTLPSTSAPASTTVTRVLTLLSYSGDDVGTVGAPLQLATTLKTVWTGDPVGPGASITISVDNQQICQGQTDAAGRAGCQWTPPGPGTFTVSAAYDGSSLYLPATGSVSLPVGRKAGTVTVRAEPATASWSDPIVITGEVPAGATGTMAFRTGGAGLPGCAAVPITGASAQCTADSLAVGPHTVSADYSGDAEHADGTGSTDLAVTARPTTISYSGSSTATVGGQLSVAARVVDQATAEPRDDATLTFELDGSSCQVPTGADGTGSCLITPSHAGTRTVGVAVAADVHHAAASTTADVDIDPAATQVTVLAPESIDVSLPATVTAQVAPTDGGTVGFSVGEQPIAGCADVPVTEADGQWTAECVTSELPVGAATIVAVFSGTENYSPATGSTTITVNRAPTELTYTGPGEAVVAAPLEVSATLTNVVGGGSDPIAGRPLTFTLGETACTADTDDTGHAACELSPAHADPDGSLLIAFGGTATESAATRPAAVAVSPAPTTVTLTVPEQVTYSSPVTLSAAVSPSDGQGTFGFAVADRPLAGCTEIDAENIDNRWQATCITTDLPVGDASVSATYSGTADYLASFDTATVAVSPAATALEITGPTTSTVGQDIAFGARLTNQATDGPAPGLSVDFDWGGWTCSATTDEEGLAICSTSPTSVEQAGSLTVRFAGTAEFLATTTTADITVEPAASTLVYTGPTTAVAGTEFTVSAELSVALAASDQVPSGTLPGVDDAPRLLGARALTSRVTLAPPPVAGTTIVFAAGSQQCTARTDTSGRATCRLTVESAGPVTLTVASSGTDQLAAALVRATLEVAAAVVSPDPSAPTSTVHTSPARTPTAAPPGPDQSTDPSATVAPTRSTPTTAAVPGPGKSDTPSATPPLATTGYPAVPAVLIGLSLLIAGALALVIARRRHPTER